MYSFPTFLWGFDSQVLYGGLYPYYPLYPTEPLSFTGCQSVLPIKVPVSNISDGYNQLENFNISEEFLRQVNRQSQQMPKIEEIEQKRNNIQNSVNVKQAGQKPKRKRKRYLSKNTQTNIMTQVFSFLLYPRKSQKILLKMLNQDQKKVEIFYAYIKTLRSHKQKHSNLEYILRIISMSDGSEQKKLVTRSPYRQSILSFEEFQRAIIKMTIYYLRSVSVLSLIRSNRLNDETLQVHLNKRRQFLRIIIEGLKKNLFR